VAASKLAHDVIYYWHWMQEYTTAVTLASKRYILEIDMAQFLLEVENPRVERLLSAFIASEKSKLGI
jgi:hypothetical protein